MCPGIPTAWCGFVERSAVTARSVRAPAGRATSPRYQRKDSFHQRAKREGFRSRAAYKLLEMQKAHRMLRAGQRVVDLGCWPGGWLQVSSDLVGPRGRVVGVDLAQLEPPIDNANTIAMVGDLEHPELSTRVRAALGGDADVVLCDAAPKLTGVRITDRALEERLLESVERLIPLLLRPGGALLLKILEGPEATTIARRIAAAFERAKSLRPAATRSGSSERYLLARGYRGLAADPRQSSDGSHPEDPDARSRPNQSSAAVPRDPHLRAVR